MKTAMMCFLFLRFRRVFDEENDEFRRKESTEVEVEQYLKKQAEMKDNENAMGTAEGKSGFDDSMEAETKASDVQKATHDIRKINEQQKEITNEDRWR